MTNFASDFTGSEVLDTKIDLFAWLRQEAVLQLQGNEAALQELERQTSQRHQKRHREMIFPQGYSLCNAAPWNKHKRSNTLIDLQTNNDLQYSEESRSLAEGEECKHLWNERILQGQRSDHLQSWQVAPTARAHHQWYSCSHSMLSFVRPVHLIPLKQIGSA